MQSEGNEKARPFLSVDRDLNLILVITGFFLILTLWLKPARFLQDTEVSLVVRWLAMLGLQFGMMGLGVLVVLIYRRESPGKYGLRAAGLGKGILFSLVACVPMLIYFLVRGVTGYLPMSNIMTVQEWTSQGLLMGVIGVVPTMLVWGFAQAFSYCVISDKLNVSDAVHSPWLQMGPIYCSLFYLVLSGYGFSLARLPEMLLTLLTVWALFQARRLAGGNAWGMILVFSLFFNSFVFV